jgi:hypothetical protein
MGVNGYSKEANNLHTAHVELRYIAWKVVKGLDGLFGTWAVRKSSMGSIISCFLI